MLLLQLITSFSALLSRAQASSPTDYGYWKISLLEDWSPTGIYYKTSTSSQYFTADGISGSLVYCAKEYNAGVGQITPCNDTSFSCVAVRGELPPRAVTMH
jgi:hypothetical protein